MKNVSDCNNFRNVYNREKCSLPTRVNENKMIHSHLRMNRSHEQMFSTLTICIVYVTEITQWDINVRTSMQGKNCFVKTKNRMNGFKIQNKRGNFKIRKNCKRLHGRFYFLSHFHLSGIDGNTNKYLRDPFRSKRAHHRWAQWRLAVDWPRTWRWFSSQALSIRWHVCQRVCDECHQDKPAQIKNEGIKNWA